MTRQIPIDIPQGVNGELLRDELRAAFGDVIAGTSRTPTGFYIVVEDWSPDDIGAQMQAVIDLHDPAQQTAAQAAMAAAATAPDRVRLISGWATWNETQVLDYIDTNVNDLASAKAVLKALARMVVALRDATWPALGVE